MTSKLILLMLLGHFLADYTLQGILADLKQISWWRERTSNPKYRNDWLTALLCHSLYWAIITFLPIYNHPYWASIVLLNAVVHALIDHAKANLKVINLQQDQILHLLQILAVALTESITKGIIR